MVNYRYILIVLNYIDLLYQMKRGYRRNANLDDFLTTQELINTVVQTVWYFIF